VIGTLGGQIVVEGFLDIRIPPAARTLVTRSVGIVPAVIVAAWFGSSGANSLLFSAQFAVAVRDPAAPAIHDPRTASRRLCLSPSNERVDLGWGRASSSPSTVDAAATA
jgi:hypothetical protein